MSKKSPVIDDFTSRVGKVRTMCSDNKCLIDSFGSELSQGGKYADLAAIGSNVDSRSTSGNGNSNSNSADVVQKFLTSKDTIIAEHVDRLTETYTLCASLDDYRRLLAEEVKYCSSVGRNKYYKTLKYKQLDVPCSKTAFQLDKMMSDLNTLIKCVELFSIDIKKDQNSVEASATISGSTPINNYEDEYDSRDKHQAEVEIVQFVIDQGEHITQLRQCIDEMSVETDPLSLTVVSKGLRAMDDMRSNISSSKIRQRHKSSIGLDFDDCVEFLDNFTMSTSPTISTREEKNENVLVKASSQIIESRRVRGSSSSGGKLGLSDDDLHHLLPMSSVAIYDSDNNHTNPPSDNCSSKKCKDYNGVLGGIHKAILNDSRLKSSAAKLITNSSSSLNDGSGKITIVDLTNTVNAEDNNHYKNDNKLSGLLESTWRHVSKSVVVDGLKTPLEKTINTSSENKIQTLRNDFNEKFAKCVENNNLPLPVVTVVDAQKTKPVAIISSVVVDSTTDSEKDVLKNRDNNSNNANKRINDVSVMGLNDVGSSSVQNTIKISFPVASSSGDSTAALLQTRQSATPPAPAGPAAVTQIPSLSVGAKQNDPPTVHEQLAAWYAVYDSSKIKTITSLLAKYVGKEGELLGKFERKYGPCPLNHTANATTTASTSSGGSDGGNNDGLSMRRPRAANSADFTAESTPIFSISKTGTAPDAVSFSGSGGFFPQGGHKVSTSPFANTSNSNKSSTPFGQSLGLRGGGAVSPFNGSSNLNNVSGIGFTNGFASPSASLFGGATIGALNSTLSPGNRTPPTGLLTPPKVPSTLFGGSGVGSSSSSSNSNTAKFGFGFGTNTSSTGGGTSPFAQKSSSSGFASPSGITGGVGFGVGLGQSSSLFGNAIGVSSHVPSSGGIEERVRAYYNQYNPAKLNDVPSLLLKYAGREMELLAALEKKYGKLSLIGNNNQQQLLQQQQQQQQQGSVFGSAFGGGVSNTVTRGGGATFGAASTLGMPPNPNPSFGFGQHTKSLFQH